MKKAKIIWQPQVDVPWWVWSDAQKKRYLAKKRPYTITDGEWILAEVHCKLVDLEQRNLEDLFWELERMGVGVAIAPEDLLLPRTRIQRMDGKKLRGLFAFALAKEMLQRKDICLGQAKYLIAGDEHLEMVLAGMGRDVNHLSFCGISERTTLEEQILAEYGLQIPHIHWRNYELLAEMDVVLWCGLPDVKWAYLLGENAVFVDVFGGYPTLDLLGQQREDVLVVTAQKGIWKGEKMPLDEWEAVVYQDMKESRGLWNGRTSWEGMVEVYEKLEGLCGVTERADTWVRPYKTMEFAPIQNGRIWNPPLQ